MQTTLFEQSTSNLSAAALTQPKLAERAILIRLSFSMPGDQRTDTDLSGEVKAEHKLGANAGRWIKVLYPPEALAAVRKLDGEIRAYHNAVTLPFDSGIGILPAALVVEYGDRMRDFRYKREALVAEFVANPQKWIDWAAENHNGTFNPALYPGCNPDPVDKRHSATHNRDYNVYEIDSAAFKADMQARFDFRAEPLPVPDASHFTATIHSLLGADADSINTRVHDAMTEAQKELLSRMIDPVLHMANKLAGVKVCPCRNCKGREAKTDNFKGSLTSNVKEIADLVPKLNLSGDPALDKFAVEMKKLASYSFESLRDNATVKDIAAAEARAMLDKLSGYKL